MLWLALVTTLVPHIRAPPGVYKGASLDLSVCVYSADFACVRWSDDCATVVHDKDRGLVFSEPLASRIRQAGLVLTRIDYDDEHKCMGIGFDGRHRVRIDLVRSDIKLPAW